MLEKAKETKERKKMIFDPVDFSEEKNKIKKTLQEKQKGKAESNREPITINFNNLVKDIEEFLDSAIRGMTSFTPHPLQKNTLICIKIFDRIKDNKNLGEEAIDEFLQLVYQDLGFPAYSYLHKLIYKEK